MADNRYHTVHPGEYRGISYKIFENSEEFPYRWAAAIFLRLWQFKGGDEQPFFFAPVQDKNGHWYFENPKFLHNMPARSIDTYWISQMYKAAPDQAYAEIGWDYGHSWDELHCSDELSLENIRHDVHENIDWLKYQFPILSKCGYCGRLGYEDTEAWVNPGFGYWNKICPSCYQKLLERKNQE